ncbi:MAG: sulfatase, partial [Planctomycetota bacterium]
MKKVFTAWCVAVIIVCSRAGVTCGGPPKHNTINSPSSSFTSWRQKRFWISSNQVERPNRTMRARVRETLLGMTVWAVAALGPLAGRSVEPVQADSPAAPEPRSPKNVILITISTLRADHVGVLGYNRDTTPIFDSFGEKNVLFRKAFASSGWMMPAHGSIFTSLYPGRHGATHIENSLDEASYTLAEILKDNGYYCVGFCCNPRLDNEHGFAQGFDVYDDYSVSVMLEAMAFGIGQDTDINRRRTNDLINDAAIRWLQNNTHQPFFMFVHYYDNHWDYLPDGTQIPREPLYSNPPSARDVEHIVALYDGEVKQTDNDLGELLEFLDDKGLMDNSIVIVAGDHGEQFYEHGHTSHQGLFEELIHVPLTVSIPGIKTKGKTIDGLVSQVDILPTILDYLQIPLPAECHGKSLKPVIEGDAEQVNDFILAEYTGGAVSDIYTVRSARYKYYE